LSFLIDLLPVITDGEHDAASVEIRRVTDLEAVKAADALFDKPVDQRAAERFLASEGHHLLLAYVATKPVGMITGVEMTHPDKGTEMFLYELGVHPDHRGLGIGRRLVRQLGDLARNRGCRGMWVLTEPDNEAAQATYRGSGGARQDDQVMFEWRSWGE
jgi:ribosomal protein S18 acetylase RimI-like enzyme